MNVGTRSILWGVHAFWFHPLTVLLAWIELYGFPNWKELVCIFIHDSGYWGKPNMDGAEGEMHPRWAADWAFEHLDCPDIPYDREIKDYFHYHDLCLYHSRTCAKKYGVEPSKLCWADKLSCKYDPWWFYLPRAVLSGEIKEYRQRAAEFGAIPLTASHLDWYRWGVGRSIRAGYSQNISPAYEAE